MERNINITDRGFVMLKADYKDNRALVVVVRGEVIDVEGDKCMVRLEGGLYEDMWVNKKCIFKKLGEVLSYINAASSKPMEMYSSEMEKINYN